MATREPYDVRAEQATDDAGDPVPGVAIVTWTNRTVGLEPRPAHVAHASPRRRTFAARSPLPQDDRTMKHAEKRAAERIRFAIDFTPALAEGDSVASAAWSDDSSGDLVRTEEVLDGNAPQALFAGGTAGQRYTLTCTATTAEGETLIEHLTLYIIS